MVWQKASILLQMFVLCVWVFFGGERCRDSQLQGSVVFMRCECDGVGCRDCDYERELIP